MFSAIQKSLVETITSLYRNTTTIIQVIVCTVGLQNNPNYYSRITYEGLMITLQNPDLNKQVSHKCMTFVCDCENFKIENTVHT